MHVYSPVRPIIYSFGKGDGGTDAAVEEDRADPRMAKLDEPIVGIESTTWEEDKGSGAQSARPLPEPNAPSAAEWARHRLTHLPYCSWCPICTSTKRPNHHHRRLKSHIRENIREIPCLVADYCYLRNTGGDTLVCLLVVKV